MPILERRVVATSRTLAYASHSRKDFSISAVVNPSATIDEIIRIDSDTLHEKHLSVELQQRVVHSMSLSSIGTLSVHGVERSKRQETSLLPML